MDILIFPEIFGKEVKAFFTGKSPGAEQDKIASIASVKKRNIYMPLQQHTDKVIVLDTDLDPKIGDAVITRTRGIFIGVQTADCVPILLYDRAAHVAGTIHAGWRGTSAGILKKTIGMMEERFFSSPSNIALAIGPSIRWCCYGVGYDVVEVVTAATGKGDYVMERGGRYCLDLQNANRYQALSVGIPEANIWTSGECTSCLPDRFYSYRFAKGPTGRQGGFIGIRDPS